MIEIDRKDPEETIGISTEEDPETKTGETIEGEIGRIEETGGTTEITGPTTEITETLEIPEATETPGITGIEETTGEMIEVTGTPDPEESMLRRGKREATEGLLSSPSWLRSCQLTTESALS